MRIELPWPDKSLSPNARGHWSKLYKGKNAYKHDCHWLTLSQTRVADRHALPKGCSLPVSITFLPPDNRYRDRDNMIAAFKSGQDGIAAALGVDDRRFIPTYEVGPVTKGGAVIFEIPFLG